MPTSAAGSKSNLHPAAKRPALSQVCVRAPQRSRQALGFTLIELLVVIALIAMGTAAVSFTLRDTAETVLERDAERLAALFESARARSRASGMPVRWHPVAASSPQNTDAFVFDGLPAQTLPNQWLSPLIQVDMAAVVVLGPDPIIGPQSIRLRAKDMQLWVSTDGLQPFKVKRAAP
jgi:general secretion pathway protein H